MGFVGDIHDDLLDWWTADDRLYRTLIGIPRDALHLAVAYAAWLRVVVFILGVQGFCRRNDDEMLDDYATVEYGPTLSAPVQTERLSDADELVIRAMVSVLGALLFAGVMSSFSVDFASLQQPAPLVVDGQAAQIAIRPLREFVFDPIFLYLQANHLLLVADPLIWFVLWVRER